MTDRELLELAAKAAGVEIYESTDGTIQNRPVWVFKAGGGMGTMPYEEQWNPLLEDGQALRLAMTLGIDLKWRSDGRVAAYRHATSRGHCSAAFESSRENRSANTRRAIVRAAAEIGRAMP